MPSRPDVDGVVSVGQSVGVPTWWNRLLRLGTRTSGRPPSANGASSFHLRWDLAGRFRSVEVTLEVLRPPEVTDLHFWALQADFGDRSGAHRGGAHLGLQWHSGHPGSTAVNWGGYDAAGRELWGSDSALPSRTGNVNTRDLGWLPGVAYRLSIDPVPGEAGWWSGSVVPLGPDRRTPSAPAVEVRRLHVPGSDELTGFVVWSEVFAPCDAPSVVVRWSDPTAVSVDDRIRRPDTCTTSYQRHEDGGCANTVSTPDELGILQVTSCERTVAPGTRLTVPS